MFAIAKFLVCFLALDLHSFFENKVAREPNGVALHYTSPISGWHIGPAYEAGLSAGMQRECVPPHGRKTTRGQSNLTKSASRGSHSPVRGDPRGSKVVPLNSWGRVSY